MKKASGLKKVIALLLVFTMLFSSHTLTMVYASEGTENQTQEATQSETNFFRSLIDSIIDFFRRVLERLGEIFGLRSGEGEENEGEEENGEGSGDENTGNGTDGPSEEDFYVSLPIIIRDYAADGMLFEWNENDTAVDVTFENNKGYDYVINPADWSENRNDSVRICTPDYHGWESDENKDEWHCIICNPNGTVKKVFTKRYLSDDEANIKETAADGNYYSNMTEGCYAVWVYTSGSESDTENYKYFEVINETSKLRFTLKCADGKVYIKRYDTAVTQQMLDEEENDPYVVWTETMDYVLYCTSDSDKWSTDGYKGIRVAERQYTKWDTSNKYWHCVICNSDGTVKKVLGNGEEKGNRSAGAYINYMTEGCYAIWVWSGYSNYTENQDAFKFLNAVTEKTKNLYKVTFDTTDERVTIEKYNKSLVEETAETTDDNTNTNTNTDSSTEEQVIADVIGPKIVSAKEYDYRLLISDKADDESSYWQNDDADGIRILKYPLVGRHPLYWHSIVCNNDGTVVKVYNSGETKADGIYEGLMTADRYSVWAHGDDQKAVYNYIKVVTEAEKNLYTVTYNTTSKKLKIIKYDSAIDSATLAQMPGVVSTLTGKINRYNHSSLTITSNSHKYRIHVVEKSASGYNAMVNSLSTPDGDEWDVFVCNADGTIEAVYRKGDHFDSSVVKDGGYLVITNDFATNNNTYGARDAYNILNEIVSSNKGYYRIGYTTLPSSDPDYVYGNNDGAFVVTKYDSQVYYNGTSTGSTTPTTPTTPSDDPTSKNETYIHGNNLGYGLLQTNAQSKFNDLPGNDDAITGSKYVSTVTWSQGLNMTEPPKGKGYVLNSGITQLAYGALIRTDLIKEELDSNKGIIYTEGTINYLAEYMRKTLQVPWEVEGQDSTYNMSHVMGTKLYNDHYVYVGPGSAEATKDLADVLRSQIAFDDMGTYEQTTDKVKAKSLKSIYDIRTYYDAAYYLLHSIFHDDDGYGSTVLGYNSLRLVSAKNEDGEDCYIFNSGYDKTTYDPENEHTIYNRDTTLMTPRYKISKNRIQEGAIQYTRGNLTPLNRFNPLFDQTLGYGNSGDIYEAIYSDIDAYGSVKKDGDYTYLYDETNYNLSLEGHAKFIYYEDNNQYFKFTGDDDVYLFINGRKVLDMGGAHAIAGCGVYLRDIADQCGLKDGVSYDFDFYYMERHGTAANFCIETNIMIVDPDMVTSKMGLQDGTSTGYGG